LLYERSSPVSDAPINLVPSLNCADAFKQKAHIQIMAINNFFIMYVILKRLFFANIIKVAK